VLVLRATKRLRDKIGGVPVTEADSPTTVLGDWYANILPWRPQVAILVNAQTLLPILTPLAPAKGLPGRLADIISTQMSQMGVPQQFIEAERREMLDVRVGPTVDRSVVGSMGEFIAMADYRRDSEEPDDLVEWSRRLAHTPCFRRGRFYGHPDKLLEEAVATYLGAHHQ